jgi:hypothetical protein
MPACSCAMAPARGSEASCSWLQAQNDLASEESAHKARVHSTPRMDAGKPMTEAGDERGRCLIVSRFSHQSLINGM